MRILGWLILTGLAVGCVSKNAGPRRTQVTTFPRGGLVEYNGKRLGQEPVEITLPQDNEGRLSGKAILRASFKEHSAEGQSKIFDPAQRTDRVPDRLMLDLSSVAEKELNSTNVVLNPTTGWPEKPDRAESPRGKDQREADQPKKL